MAHRRQTPQEKQRRALDERVDAWGESQKSFRRNGPKMIARTQRAYRRAWSQRLVLVDDDAIAVRRRPSRTWVGPRRGDHLADQRERAASRREVPRRSREARARRRSSR